MMMAAIGYVFIGIIIGVIAMTVLFLYLLGDGIHFFK